MSAKHTHQEAIRNLHQFVRALFRNRGRQVAVIRDVLIYYKPRSLRHRAAPDLYVVLDHSEEGINAEGTFKTWREGKTPDFAMEVLSPGTEGRDRTHKKDVYRQLGVSEYFMFQPEEARPGPDRDNPLRRLQGFRLEEGAYREIKPDADGSVHSRTLNASLFPERRSVRVRDAETGLVVPPASEVEQALESEERGRREAEERVDREARGRREAEERADREAQGRREAEERADREARGRREAEERALEAETRAAREAVGRLMDRQKIEELQDQVRLLQRGRGGGRGR